MNEKLYSFTILGTTLLGVLAFALLLFAGVKCEQDRQLHTQKMGELGMVQCWYPRHGFVWQKEKCQ